MQDPLVSIQPMAVWVWISNDAELVRSGGGRRCGLLRVQAVELRVAMKNGEVRVAASPNRVSEPRFPGFAQGIQGLLLSIQAAVHTSRVIENRGFVGAQ